MTFNDVFYKNRFLISLKSFTTFRRLYRLERKIWSPAYPRAAVLVLENWKRLRNSVSLLSQFFFCKIYPATYFADIRDLENFRVFESFQKIVEAWPVSTTGVYLRYAAIGRSCKAQSFGYSIIRFSFSLYPPSQDPFLSIHLLTPCLILRFYICIWSHANIRRRDCRQQQEPSGRDDETI